MKRNHFFTIGKSNRLPSEILKRAAMRLQQLDSATKIEDLRLPSSNPLEALQGKRPGYWVLGIGHWVLGIGHWSIRINQQWRVCLELNNGDAIAVEIVDYH